MRARAVGEQIGWTIIDLITENYEITWNQETLPELNRIVSGYRTLINRLITQRQKAIQTISELLIGKEKIDEAASIEKAKRLVGIATWPMPSSLSEFEGRKRDLENAKKKLEDAYRKTRKSK